MSTTWCEAMVSILCTPNCRKPIPLFEHIELLIYLHGTSAGIYCHLLRLHTHHWHRFGNCNRQITTEVYLICDWPLTELATRRNFNHPRAWCIFPFIKSLHLTVAQSRSNEWLQAHKITTSSESSTLRETKPINGRSAISNMQPTVPVSTWSSSISCNTHPPGYIYWDVHVREVSKLPWHSPMENATKSCSIL